MFYVLSEAITPAQRLLEIWNATSGWILGLGITGIAGIFINSTVNFKGMLSNNKVYRLVEPMLSEVKKIKNEVVDLTKGIVEEVKEVRLDYKNILKLLDNNELKNNKVLSSLGELTTITIALSTSPTELKSQALAIIKNLGLDLQSISLLEKSIELRNDSNSKDDALQDIIDSEL